MTSPREPDARIAAFFAATQPDLPDRTFDAVRREIHAIRQRAFLERLPRFAIGAAAVLSIALALISVQLVLLPGGRPGPSQTVPPTVEPSPTAKPSATAPQGPTTFTSPLYGYTVTIPQGWLAAPALVRWNGVNQPGPDADTDRFAGPAERSALGFAGPFSGDLAALVSNRIAANARDHADTCPVATPAVNAPIQIGSQRWVLLGWNCGAFINQAITLRAGMAYAFTFRDLGVGNATDPADRALFLSILDSVQLPS
jgi:hypothetical protein